MGNRITYHGKIGYHLILLSFLIFLSSSPTCASTLSINIYLKLDPKNQINRLIHHFNQFLEKKRILSTYSIEPFLDKHPLHITLYLANYEENKLPQIINGVAALAKNTNRIRIKTEHFITQDSGYIMLSVKASSELKNLSEKTMRQFFNLRDKTVTIPGWAAADLKRQYLFNHYGSPNVLDYFNPHFSILDPVHLNLEQRHVLAQCLKRLIKQWEENHVTSVDVKTYSIGVGTANSQGQIIKEWASFPLDDF